MTRHVDDYDDPEGPDDFDLDDEEETVTVACPSCEREIAELTEQCPHCGDWITHSTSPASRRGIGFLVVVILLIAGLLWWLL